MTISSQSTTTTTLQSIILKRIEQKTLSHHEILTLMGYHNHPKTTDKAINRLQTVLSSPALGLTNKTYDFKYAASEFVEKLCSVLGIDKIVYQPLLAELERDASHSLNAITPIVYADITFNEDFRPSFNSYMAVDRFKRISLDDEVRLLPRQKQLDIINERITAHYKAMQGKIPFAGVIKGYKVVFNNGRDDEARLYIAHHQL